MSVCFLLVEILIRLLETDEYINNTIRTSWLDGLIATHFQTEKPNIILSVICAAIHIADETFRSNFQNFRSSLERGQILPMNTLSISRQVELVNGQTKYKLQVRKSMIFFVFLIIFRLFR